MVTRPQVPSSTELEDTAELPTLSGISSPVAADQGHSGADGRADAHARTPVLGTARSADTVRRADLLREQRTEQGLREAEIAALRSELASTVESRSELERKLLDATTNLRELEQRLDRNSGQLAASERELGLRDGRIEALEAQLRAISHEHSATSAQRDALGAELERAREDAADARSRLQSQAAAASAWMAERGARARRLQDLEADAAEARAQAERYRELLQNLESRRALFTAMLAERDSIIGEREARILALTREIADRSALTGAREEDLQVLLQVERQHLRQRDGEIAALHVAQQAQLSAARAAAQQAQEDAAALAAEIGSQGQTIGELRSQLGALRESLEQRDALLERLQARAVGGDAVPGDVQEHPDATGTHEPTRMLVRTEGETGIVQLLSRCTTIGRTPDNDIRIDADFISRHHAVVLVSGAMTVLEDLNSTNGTYVNGERIGRCALTEGDLVTLGKTEFRFVVKQPIERAG